jgi:tetratricopeptide (TPR) repeat protein
MVSSRRRVTRKARQGLRQLLTGGLFLQAMRDIPDQALTFGEQACAELEGARRQLQKITLPVETLAGVYERMGWAHQRAGEPALAMDNFRTAVALWQDAENLTRDGTGAAEEKLVRLLDRRLKAQLESGDPVLGRTALADLKSISAPAALLTNRVWLYNRACLYAQASKADTSADYQQRALLWLGRALIQYGDSSMWEYAEHYDAELAPICSILGPFLTCLRRLISGGPAQEEREALLTQAIKHVSGQG